MARNENQARILKLLSQYLTIKEIAKLTSKRPVTIYKAFLSYRKKGWINEDRSLTNEGFQKVELAMAISRKVEFPANSIRLHNLVFIIDIPKENNRVINAQKILEIKKIDFKTIDMGTWKAKQIIIDNRKIWVNPKKLVIYMGNYYADTPIEAYTLALDELKSLVHSIQSKLRIKLIVGHSISFSVSRQHFALIKNEIAMKYNNEKKKLFVYDNENRLRLMVDDSLNLDELESVDKEKAMNDAEKTREVLLDIIEKPSYLPSTAKEIIDKMAIENLKLAQETLKTAQNFDLINKNIELHLDVLRNINKGINNFGTKIAETIRAEFKKLSEVQTKLDRFT